MSRIDADFERLQPIARNVPLEYEGVRCGRDKTIKVGKCRWLARPHVGKDDAVAFTDRISLVPNFGVERAALRLGRSFETLSAHVEQPAVKRAAQPSVFGPPEGEIGAAMRTRAIDKSIAPGSVAKEPSSWIALTGRSAGSSSARAAGCQ